MRQWQRDFIGDALEFAGGWKGVLQHLGGRWGSLETLARPFDVLHGTADHEVIDGLGGRDHLLGHLGRDRIDGGAGADLIRGGGDHDRLQGGAGHDTVLGGTGHDTVLGGRGSDKVFGGHGNDRLGGDVGRDLVSGGRGADWAAGGDGADTVLGGKGDDTVEGGAGADLLSGGFGNDVYLFTGDFGDDQIVGFEPGRDTIVINGASSENLTFTKTALGIRIDVDPDAGAAQSPAPVAAPAATTQFSALAASSVTDLDPIDLELDSGPGPVVPAGGSVTIVGVTGVAPTDIQYTPPPTQDPYSPVVTTAEDKYEENPSPDELSLREALDIAANDPDNTYQITFDSTVFAEATTIRLDPSLGTIRVSGNVIIQGPSGSDGMPLVTLSGDTAGNDDTREVTLAEGADYFPGAPVDTPGWSPTITDVESSRSDDLMDDNVTVLFVGPASNVQIYDLIVTGGAATEGSASSLEGDGGGIVVFNSTLRMGDVVVGGNHAEGDGGGIFLAGGTLNLAGTVAVIGNAADNHGGGIALSETSSTATFSSNAGYGFLTGNTAGGVGGGLYLEEAAATLSGWNFVGNTSEAQGGGAFVSDDDKSQLSLSSVSFVNNTASLVGSVWNGPDNLVQGDDVDFYGNTQPDVSGPYDELPYGF